MQLWVWNKALSRELGVQSLRRITYPIVPPPPGLRLRPAAITLEAMLESGTNQERGYSTANVLCFVNLMW